MKISLLLLIAFAITPHVHAEGSGHEALVDTKPDPAESVDPNEALQAAVAKKMAKEGDALYDLVFYPDLPNRITFADKKTQSDVKKLVTELQTTAEKVKWGALNATGEGVYQERLLKYLCPGAAFADHQGKSFGTVLSLLTNTEASLSRLLKDPAVRFESPEAKKNFLVALTDIAEARSAVAKNKPSEGTDEEAFLPKTKDDFRVLLGVVVTGHLVKLSSYNESVYEKSGCRARLMNDANKNSRHMKLYERARTMPRAREWGLKP